MRTRVAVAGMTALLALYLVVAVQYGVTLIRVGSPVGIGIGIALLVFPVVAAGALVAEFAFTVRAGRLGRRLEADGELPGDQLPTLPSGRIDREAAAEVFPRYRAAVEASPDDWRTWYRLGLAYDAAGDRGRARWAMRQAIRRSRAPRP